MIARFPVLALCLVSSGYASAQPSTFTLDGEIVRQARIASFCARGGNHCDEQFSGGHYREATCQWTVEPGVALCLFVIDYDGGPGSPNRQLMRRSGETWVAVWR